MSESSSSDWEEVDQKLIAIKVRTNFNNEELEKLSIPVDAQPDEDFLKNNEEKERKYNFRNHKRKQNAKAQQQQKLAEKSQKSDTTESPLKEIKLAAPSLPISQSRSKSPNSSKISEKSSEDYDTINTGRIKVIGLETKAPVLGIGSELYLMEETPVDRSILVTVDKSREKFYENERNKSDFYITDMTLVDCMFRTARITCEEKADPEVT